MDYWAVIGKGRSSFLTSVFGPTAHTPSSYDFAISGHSILLEAFHVIHNDVPVFHWHVEPWFHWMETGYYAFALMAVWHDRS